MTQNWQISSISPNQTFRKTTSIRKKVDVRLPGKGNSTPHGARPVHLIVTMIKWIQWVCYNSNKLPRTILMLLGPVRSVTTEFFFFCMSLTYEPASEPLHISVK